MTLASLTPVVSLFLIPLLAAPPGWSQTAVSQSSLQLKIIDSDGSQVAANSRSSKAFFVQVTDGNGAAIPDAAVALRLPDSGASGVFADGSHSAVVYTDASGKAHVDGIQWSATPGALAVRITATKGDDHAGMLLEENLVAGGTTSVTPPRLEAATPVPVRAAEPIAPAVASQVRTSEDAAPLNTIPATNDGVPIRPVMRAAASGSQVPFLRSTEPSVSISNDGPGPAYHGSSSKKKWIWIGLAIAAGAGAAYAVSSMNKGSTAASSSSISIGAPTVSVGHP